MTISRPDRARPDWSDPRHWLAFGLGAGASPYAPGTVGTLVGIPLYLALQSAAPAVYLGVVVLLFLIGIPLCGRVAQDLSASDPGGIVYDEIVGLLIALWLVPPGWIWILAAFVLFRFFDIVKPWPISWLDRRVSGGLGIMLDDAVAGLFALGGVQLLAHIWRLWAGPA